MSKKVTKKSKKTKENIPLKPEACSGCEILIVIGIIAAVITGILYLTKSWPFASSEIKYGQCYINRAYQPVQVVSVYKSLNEVTLRPATVKESSIFGGWYLEQDYSQNRVERTLDFVRENYTLVKCANYEL